MCHTDVLIDFAQQTQFESNQPSWCFSAPPFLQVQTSSAKVQLPCVGCISHAVGFGICVGTRKIIK